VFQGIRQYCAFINTLSSFVNTLDCVHTRSIMNEISVLVNISSLMDARVDEICRTQSNLKPKMTRGGADVVGSLSKWKVALIAHYWPHVSTPEPNWHPRSALEEAENP
jgi:hypothetical protein